MNPNIISTLHRGIVFSILLFTFFSCSQPGDVEEGIYAPVEYITIRFTEHVVEMPDPHAVVSLEALIEKADSVREVLEQFDPDATIKRSYPDYNHKNGTTNDWSKIFRIQFTRKVPFYDLKDPLEVLDLVVWVDPPVLIWIDV